MGRDEKYKEYMKDYLKKYYKENREHIRVKARERYNATRDKIYAYHARRKKEAQEYLYEYKKDGCIKCGAKPEMRKLQFHHRPGEIKKFWIGAAWERNKEDVIAEIKKCDLLCVSCHKKEHEDQRRLVVAMICLSLKYGSKQAA